MKATAPSTHMMAQRRGLPASGALACFATGLHPTARGMSYLHTYGLADP
jgi:hypothetical protein